MTVFKAQTDTFALYLPDKTPLLPDLAEIFVDLSESAPQVRLVVMMDAADAENLQDSGVFGDMDLPSDPSATYTLEVHLVAKDDMAMGQASFLQGQDNPALVIGEIQAPADASGYSPLYKVENYQLEEWALHDIVTYGLGDDDDEDDDES